MSKKLISLGHGKSKSGSYDPGAAGNGTTEAEFLRGSFLTSLKKYAGNKIDLYETNMYADRTAATIKGYSDVTELHLDAASASAEDGHIIIHKSFKPDATDLRIRDVIEKHVGAKRYKDGISYRDDLRNLNNFAKRGIAYRLVELAFITNKQEMDYMKANYDAYAKDLVEAILNSSIESKPTVNEPEGKYTVKAGDTLWAIAQKQNVTVAQLKSWNKLESDLITIGQVLTIEGVQDTSPVVDKKPAETPAAVTKKKYSFSTQTLYRKTPQMSGTAVKTMQEALASIYFYPNKGAKNNGVDGYFGPKTEDAVKRFQKMYGLAVDGRFGPASRAKLESLVNQ